MSNRAAILPFPGDPFLLTYWLHTYEKYWSNQVDKLYIYFNSPIEDEVVSYIKNLCLEYPKVNLQYNNVQIEHGEAINRTLDIVREDLVMLIEDDGFIFNYGIIEYCFQQIEQDRFDIVGGKRGSCGFELLERAKDRWRLDYTGLGDQGPNFWPCFFFCRKQLLLNTDRVFGSKMWKAGERCEPLNFNVETDQCGDTFVNTSLQLRDLVPISRILCIPQYHGSPDDLVHYENHQFLFDGKAPWCHIGSLSTGVGGLLRDNQNRALARRLIDPPESEIKLPPICNTEQETHEFERRVQWWLRFYNYYMSFDHPEEMPNFTPLYKNAIETIINQYKLSRKRIDQRLLAYASLGL
jgi:hypothetical protein